MDKIIRELKLAQRGMDRLARKLGVTYFDVPQKSKQYQRWQKAWTMHRERGL